MNLFKDKDEDSINLSDIEKELKEYQKQKIKHYLNKLEKLEYLMFYEGNNLIDGAIPHYELLNDGRKYLYEKKQICNNL